MGLCKGRGREGRATKRGETQKKKARKRGTWSSGWPLASGGIYAPLGPAPASGVVAPPSQGIGGGQASNGGTATYAPQVGGGGTKFGGTLAIP